MRELMLVVTTATCAERARRILGFEVMPDHVHLFLSCPPKWALSDIVKIVKGVTARRVLRGYRRLSRRGHLWTDAFYVGSAGTVTADTIQYYIETQRSGRVE